MAYKAALAGLDLGGGKAVIIGDPATLKTEALLRAYGRFVRVAGRPLLTACDVGTYSEDMDVVARECAYVTGRTVAHGGAGDSSVLTAYGVFQGMRAAARTHLGRADAARPHASASPASARSAATWCGTSSRTAPSVVVTDVADGRGRRGAGRAPGGPRRSPTPTPWSRTELDVYAPCALGGALDRRRRRDALAPRSSAAPPTTSSPTPASRSSLAGPRRALRARLRGQRRRPDPGRRRARGVLVRAGRRQRADEDLRHHRARSSRIADAEGVPPAVAADRMAERRMAEVGRLRGIWLG